MVYHLIHYNAVPAPTVTVSVSSGALNEGTSLILTCTATLPPWVDTDVNITINWTADISNERVTLSPPTSDRSPFISTLTLSPLLLTDSGLYYCEVSAASSSPYITTSSLGQSQQQHITVTGKPNSIVIYQYKILHFSQNLLLGQAILLLLLLQGWS